LSSKPKDLGIEAFHDHYVLGKDKCEGSSNFLRIKIPNGRLSTHQLREITALSTTYGRSYAEITDRQNIQLHWIEPQNAVDIFKRLEVIGLCTDHGGQGIPTAHGGDVRAIISCPAAGLDKHELIDPWPIVRELDTFFNGNRDFLDLPRKFKIAINTCSQNCANPEAQDISYTSVKQKDGKVGFVVYVGGTVAAVPQLAKPLNAVVGPEQILSVTRCAAEIFRDFGQREVKAKARFRWLVESWGTEKLKAAIEEKMGTSLRPAAKEHLLSCKEEHAGVRPQKQAGYSYINVPINSGVLSSEKMLEIAQIADSYGNGELRLTPYQNIIVANIPNEEVGSALKETGQAGFSAVNPYLKWATIACAGNFCGKTLDHPKNRAKETLQYLETHFGTRLEKAKVRLSFSGCPNGCARHLISDIGLQGTAVAVDGKNVAAYNLYVREDSNAPSLGKLVERGINAEQVKFAIANLVEAYLKADTKETFPEFCKKLLKS
jgi:sulfite reductase (ferredoxin)